MNTDPNILLRLKNSNQTHLLSYWEQLDYEQRAILIREIENTDFDYITQAFQGVQDQLNEHENEQTIDQMMKPVPENLTGSVDKTSKEQLQNYRREGELKSSQQKLPNILILSKV
jgi:UDP-N-acetylglucosamine/UDP-N-acetylgalactosamine diphosphorylase